MTNDVNKGPDDAQPKRIVPGPVYVTTLIFIPTRSRTVSRRNRKVVAIDLNSLGGSALPLGCADVGRSVKLPGR
jgi:hypothetical protein